MTNSADNSAHTSISTVSWALSKENVDSNMHKMSIFGSSCACAKYQPGLCSPFIHSVGSNDSVSRQWRPWSDCVDAQAEWALAIGICPKKHLHMAWPNFLSLQITAHILLSPLQPLYNTIHYNTVLDITQFKDGSQKCIDYIEKWP